jgi:hypothetical protein
MDNEEMYDDDADLIDQVSDDDEDAAMPEAAGKSQTNDNNNRRRQGGRLSDQVGDDEPPLAGYLRYVNYTVRMCLRGFVVEVYTSNNVFLDPLSINITT